MNDNAKKWVAALRSGEFQQCTERLTNGQAYCCLGVGCAISPLDRVLWENRISLPLDVMRWLGLADRDGTYGLDALTYLNDEQGKTFADIADVIESEPEGLFVSERDE